MGSPGLSGVGQTQVYLQHLRMHQVRHQLRRCPTCKLNFTNKSDYQVHRRLDHKATRSPSSDAQDSFERDPNALSCEQTTDQVVQYLKDTQPHITLMNAPEAGRVKHLASVRMPENIESINCLECVDCLGSASHKQYLSCSMCRFGTYCSTGYNRHMSRVHIYISGAHPTEPDISMPMARPVYFQWITDEVGQFEPVENTEIEIQNALLQPNTSVEDTEMILPEEAEKLPVQEDSTCTELVEVEQQSAIEDSTSWSKPPNDPFAQSEEVSEDVCMIDEFQQNEDAPVAAVEDGDITNLLIPGENVTTVMADEAEAQESTAIAPVLSNETVELQLPDAFTDTPARDESTASENDQQKVLQIHEEIQQQELPEKQVEQQELDQQEISEESQAIQNQQSTTEEHQPQEDQQQIFEVDQLPEDQEHVLDKHLPQEDQQQIFEVDQLPEDQEQVLDKHQPQENPKQIIEVDQQQMSDVLQPQEEYQEQQVEQLKEDQEQVLDKHEPQGNQEHMLEVDQLQEDLQELSQDKQIPENLQQSGEAYQQELSDVYQSQMDAQQVSEKDQQLPMNDEQQLFEEQQLLQDQQLIQQQHRQLEEEQEQRMSLLNRYMESQLDSRLFACMQCAITNLNGNSLARHLVEECGSTTVTLNPNSELVQARLEAEEQYRLQQEHQQQEEAAILFEPGDNNLSGSELTSVAAQGHLTDDGDVVMVNMDPEQLASYGLIEAPSDPNGMGTQIVTPTGGASAAGGTTIDVTNDNGEVVQQFIIPSDLQLEEGQTLVVIHDEDGQPQLAIVNQADLIDPNGTQLMMQTEDEEANNLLMYSNQLEEQDPEGVVAIEHEEEKENNQFAL